MAEWGNGDNQQHQVNMETAENSENTLKVRDVNEDAGGAAKIGIETANTNISANARALKATGMSEIVANVDANNDTVGLKVTNTSARNGSKAIVANGKVEINGEICNESDDLTVDSALHVLQQLFAESSATVSGSLVCEDTVVCEDTLRVDGQFTVGPGDAAGQIDAVPGGVGLTPRELKIGTQASTDDVIIGRENQVVNVVGGLRVGPDDDGGLIDANGPVLTPQDLKVGTGTSTSDVVVGRATRTVDIMTKTRVNSNACILNGANNITDAAGIGFVVNAVGHGNGASIDFYINGVVEGWLDSTGFVNA